MPRSPSQRRRTPSSIGAPRTMRQLRASQILHLKPFVPAIPRSRPGVALQAHRRRPRAYDQSQRHRAVCAHHDYGCRNPPGASSLRLHGRRLSLAGSQRAFPVVRLVGLGDSLVRESRR